ncbi:hypothetical protein GCM10009077_03850 [Roseibium denhamense]|uniref:YggT family protein n=1 Tax=Roseibium denhamense TaxID=76305 RepID=A0ABY1PIQ8_9HYPH|nr:hypothetical protein SAMN06265374_3807 [Roseibium denhamense]
MYVIEDLLFAYIIIWQVYSLLIVHYRSYLFRKIDPERKYHTVNFRGLAIPDVLNPETPDIMVQIFRKTAKANYILAGIFIMFCIMLAISNVM